VKINPYSELPGKVLIKDERFHNVMAIALNPLTDYKDGLVRCVSSRQGNVGVKGYIDRSELYLIQGDLQSNYKITDPLHLINEESILNKIKGANKEFIGIEDPDIWIDDGKVIHVYFTLVLREKGRQNSMIYLGHAEGRSLYDLEMKEPVIKSDNDGRNGAKEVLIAPVNSSGIRLNLVESTKLEGDVEYSVIRIAKCSNMEYPWILDSVVFHPNENKIPWIAGHASPGPLFPESFIEVGKGKRLGVINGRQANLTKSGEIKYGMFSIGLFIYDYENGRIDWVSKEPFIVDSEAATITFASQFVETGKGTGLLYAHVDDSFVRAYKLNASDLTKLLP
jgi:hypothetical protein